MLYYSYKSKERTKTMKTTTKKTAQLETLTKENAKTAKTIINKTNPEWGTWRLNYKAQPLNDGMYTHTITGRGGETLLSENEFHLWSVVK
jgi:hypothetical protein